MAIPTHEQMTALAVQTLKDGGYDDPGSAELAEQIVLVAFKLMLLVVPELNVREAGTGKIFVGVTGTDVSPPTVIDAIRCLREGLAAAEKDLPPSG